MTDNELDDASDDDLAKITQALTVGAPPREAVRRLWMFYRLHRNVPPHWLHLHLGMLCGIVDRLTEDTTAPPPRPAPSRFVLTLSSSQRMALLDMIVGSMVGPARLQVYVDIMNQTETTPDELLELVMNATVFP